MSDNVYLSREEQIFLMEMLELDDPVKALERFATIMVEEKASTSELEKYLKRIMNRVDEKNRK